MVRRVAVIAVVLCLRLQVALADGDYPSEAGYGVLAVATNLLYMPAKLVYATLGGLTGGLAYLLTVGDMDTAESIWSPSLGGTYVVSTRMLRGEDPVLFSGESHSKN